MVWDLRTKGLAQWQIADKVGISQGQVSRILKLATEEFAKEYLQDIKSYKEQQIVQYEALCSDLYDSWSKSKEGFIDNKYGDPRYIETWRKLQEDIRKMLGMDYIEDLEEQAPIGKIEIEVVNAGSVNARKKDD